MTMSRGPTFRASDCTWRPWGNRPGCDPSRDKPPSTPPLRKDSSEVNGRRSALPRKLRHNMTRISAFPCGDHREQAPFRCAGLHQGATASTAVAKVHCNIARQTAPAKHTSRIPLHHLRDDVPQLAFLLGPELKIEASLNFLQCRDECLDRCIGVALRKMFHDLAMMLAVRGDEP